MVGIRPLSLVLLMLALVIPSAAHASEPATRIIVKRAPDLTAHERQDVRDDAGVRLVDTLRLPETEVVAAPAGEASEALRELRADEDVVYAEIDRVRTAFATNDAYYGWLWALENTGQYVWDFGTGTPDADMDVVEAWTLSTGKGQTVAVVDSGVDRTHPDLGGQVLAGGYDWIDNDTTPNDLKGHGTHVAGTIVAVRNNLEGVAGVAPDARVLPLRVLDASGNGTTSDVAQALDWAGDHGLRIVNASLGSEGFSNTERAAIASHPQTLYVVAAGNDGADVDTNPVYPCAYDLANVICVAASDPNDQPTDFSNYGDHSVDVFAPGRAIISTQLGEYWKSDGTSPASPHVAAEAALLRARNPGLTVAQVRTAILGHADPSPALAGKVATGARANAYKALQSVPANPNAQPPVIATDVDNDNVPDAPDNCDVRYNPSQADADRDGVGDACDTTPRGPDVDGDRKPALDDRCPTRYGTGSDGCPVSTATSPADRDRDGRTDASDGCPTEPALTLDGCPLPAVTQITARSRHRRVTIKVRTSRAASVRITVQRKRGRRWVRVARKTLVTKTNGVSYRTKRLQRGRYRALVILSSSAGRTKAQAKAFRVR